MVFIIFIQIFKRNFSLQTVENLIRRRVSRRLIWFCTAYRCPIKRILGLYLLKLCAATDPTTSNISTILRPKFISEKKVETNKSHREWWEFGSFRIDEQRRLGRACAYAHTRQMVLCSHTQTLDKRRGFGRRLRANIRLQAPLETSGQI